MESYLSSEITRNKIQKLMQNWETNLYGVGYLKSLSPKEKKLIYKSIINQLTQSNPNEQAINDFLIALLLSNKTYDKVLFDVVNFGSK